MNEKRQQLLELCAQRPRSARELVQETGDRVGTVSSRLHDLFEIGALSRTRTNDKKPVYVYQAVPDWKPKDTPEITPYKPRGMCIWGVWM